MTFSFHAAQLVSMRHPTPVIPTRRNYYPLQGLGHNYIIGILPLLTLPHVPHP